MCIETWPLVVGGSEDLHLHVQKRCLSWQYTFKRPSPQGNPLTLSLSAPALEAKPPKSKIYIWFMAFESQFSGPSSRVDGRLQRARKSWTRGLKTTPYRDPVPISSAPYGDAIASIDIRNISLRDVIPRIEHVEYAASYNWLDVERASILVPGQCEVLYATGQRELMGNCRLPAGMDSTG